MTVCGLNEPLKNISDGRLKAKSGCGRSNPRFKYEIEQNGGRHLVREFYEANIDKHPNMNKHYTGFVARVREYIENGKHQKFFDDLNARPVLANI